MHCSIMINAQNILNAMPFSTNNSSKVQKCVIITAIIHLVLMHSDLISAYFIAIIMEKYILYLHAFIMKLRGYRVFYKHFLYSINYLQ